MNIYSIARCLAWCGCVVWLHLAATAAAQNSAPSSHLVFNDDFPGDIVVHEVRVPANGETLHTYYEVLGWRGLAAGYAGVQAHPRGRNFLFSIWDNERHTAPIRVIHRGPGTLTEPFGGEGTGMKSWNFELGWDTDVWITLAARCWPVGEHTHYGFWVRRGPADGWTHLVTMDVAAPNAWIAGGTDAFLEDWLATGEKSRTIHLRGGWKRRVGGEWFAFTEGRYSVNAWDLEPGKRSFAHREHWNAGVRQDATGPFYFMTAGGKDTRPEVANPSQLRIARAETEPNLAPLKLDALQASWKRQGLARIRWETDPRGAPLFAVEAAWIMDAGRGPGPEPVRRVDPHMKAIELTPPPGVEQSRLAVRMTCEDIFGRRSERIVQPTADESAG